MAKNRHPPWNIASSSRLGSAQNLHKKVSSWQHIWAVRLSTKKLTTEKLMATRGYWPTPACLRNCGHSTKDIIHIFQCQKGDETWEKLKKVLRSWGEWKKSAPNLISAILHGISSVDKDTYQNTSNPLTTSVLNAFKNNLTPAVSKL